MFMFYSFYQMYYYSDVQTTHTTYPDGLEVLQFPRFEYSKMCYTPEVSYSLNRSKTPTHHRC